ncbi:MAG: hypothetical protein ACR2PG_02580, partial [Hyphomicrobiaceae bacterium]
MMHEVVISLHSPQAMRDLAVGRTVGRKPEVAHKLKRATSDPQATRKRCLIAVSVDYRPVVYYEWFLLSAKLTKYSR